MTLPETTTPEAASKLEQTPREKIAKLAAMSDDEFDRFMLWNFQRICQKPLTLPSTDGEMT